VAARRSPRLLTTPLPESARRLFWSWPGGQPPAEEQAAVAVLLAEGGRREWVRVDPRSLAACARELPLPGSLREAWARYAEEEVAMADGRERVMNEGQRHILRVAASVLPAFGFELAGGTALAAAYLGHRRSEDLDLFTGEREIGPALEAFRDALRREGLAVEAEPHQVGRTFARLFVGPRPVKVELGCDRPFHIRPSTRTLEGMPVRSLEDLAADKVLALFGRAEARDFVDVYQLLRTHFDWSELLDLARRKDPGFREEWFVRALRQVDRVGPGCVEPLVPLDFEDLRSEFVRAAARLIRRATQRERDEGRGL
jgi:hypothetical protein